MSPIWLIPAVVFIVGAIIVFDALRRLANEAELLAQRMATVRSQAPDVERLQVEAHAVAASVGRLTRR